VPQPAVRHGRRRVAVTGDEGQFLVEENRASCQGDGEVIFNVEVGFAEARARRDAEHLAAVFVQRAFGCRTGRPAHMPDEILMRAVVAQPAKNAINMYVVSE